MKNNRIKQKKEININKLNINKLINKKMILNN